jgi:hypothetical protein
MLGFNQSNVQRGSRSKGAVMRALIVVAAVGLATSPAIAIAAPSAPATPTAPIQTTQATQSRISPASETAPDASRYADREQPASQLENFEGGSRVIVGISGGTLLLIVLLVILLV